MRVQFRIGIGQLLKVREFNMKQDDNSENEEVQSLGWDAITAECERVYPDQKNPKHYGTLIKWALGGKDPLDGISIYDGGDYWHFVTFGMSELYEKESDDAQYSGYGMEFTFKLKKEAYEDEEGELCNICNILQTIARITFMKDELFLVYEYLYTGQTKGIDSKQESNITGFITIPDNELRTIETPNGTVEFVSFIGATNAELLAIQHGEISVEELYDQLGSDVTDYHRVSVK